MGNELLELGVVGFDDDRFQEMALVGQLQGPMRRCDWLEWRRHKEGYTYCWAVGTDPDPMHAPENWTPAQSRGLVFHDIRDEQGRCMKLADENGRETWVDFKTGAVLEGLPPRPADAQPAKDITAEGPTFMAESLFEGNAAPDFSGGGLLATVRAMLDGRGYHYEELSSSALSVSIRAEGGLYTVFFTTNDTTDLVKASTCYGSYIPENRRVAIAEALARINARISLGNFELDFADGELRYRISFDVEGGLLSEKMVDNMLGFTLNTMDRFHEPLMRVAFGGAEPESALASIP